MASNSRIAFEETTGYNEVPKSAQDLLDLNSWPVWNLAWNKAISIVGPEIREAVQALVTVVESECENIDENKTPVVLREAMDRMHFKMEVLGSQP